MTKIEFTNAMTVNEAREQISAYGKALDHRYTFLLRVHIAILALLVVLCVCFCLTNESIGAFGFYLTGESVYVFGVACRIILPIAQLVLVQHIVFLRPLSKCNRALGDLSFFDGCSGGVVFHFENRYACYQKGKAWRVYGDIGLDIDSEREALRAKVAQFRFKLVALRNIGLVLFIGTMIAASEMGYEVSQEVESSIGANWVLDNFCYSAAALVVFGEIYLAFTPWMLIIALDRFMRAVDEGKVSALELFDVSRRYDISKFIFPMGQY